MNLTLPDEDKPARSNGPHFRVIVLLPEFVERLIEKLGRYWTRRRVR
jgi:hypothetical protein